MTHAQYIKTWHQKNLDPIYRCFNATKLCYYFNFLRFVCATNLRLPAAKKNNFCCVFAIFIIFDIDAWHSNRVRILIPFVYFLSFHLRSQRQWTVIIWTISYARSRAKDQATFIVYHNLFTHFTNYQSHKMHRPKRSICIETTTRRSLASHLTTPHWNQLQFQKSLRYGLARWGGRGWQRIYT